MLVSYLSCLIRSKHDRPTHLSSQLSLDTSCYICIQHINIVCPDSYKMSPIEFEGLLYHIYIDTIIKLYIQEMNCQTR